MVGDLFDDDLLHIDMSVSVSLSLTLDRGKDTKKYGPVFLLFLPFLFL